MDPALRATFEELARDDRRREALGHVADAFAEALHAGVEADYVAEAALSASLRELVAAHGEETMSCFLWLLAAAVRTGEYTPARRH